MAHLFLSYAHDDLDRVQQFLAILESTGHKVWIDKEELKAGAQWEKAIKLAITESYGVLFAVTAAFLDSDYIRDKEIPWTLDRFGHWSEPPVFPVRFEAVDPPQAIAGFQRVDATSGDDIQVVAELKSQLPAPSEGRHRFLVDWPRLVTFQGRGELLRQLHQQLQQRQDVVGVKTAGLYGMGGIGKTQLAVEYAHRYRFHYPAGVYWVNAAQDWTRETADLADNLGLTPADPNAPDRDRQMAAAFNNYLRQQGDAALIVLDNVENPLDVLHREIGPKLKMIDLPAHLLVTTRRQDLPEGFAALSVSTLPPGDARQILLAARPEAADDPAIDHICQAVGYLPLALGLAAAALKKKAPLAPAKYLEFLQQYGVDAAAQKADLTPADLNTPAYYDIAVGAALDWHWDQIESEDARHLLTLAAAYGQAAVLPLARLRLLANLHDDPDGWDQPFTEAMAELYHAGLTETVGAATIRLHPLVRDYVRRRRPDHATRLAAAAGLLVTAYRTPGTLHKEAKRRGFGLLQGDLRQTAAALPGDAPGRPALSQLARFFDWEGHHLRAWQPDEQPAYLIQHIRERAHHQGDDGLREACDGWLSPFIHFRTEDAWRFPVDPALVRVFLGHEGRVHDVVVIDEGHALSASKDTTLRLWDLRTGQTLRVFEGHTDEVTAVTRLDKGHALSASRDTTLRLWDLSTGQTTRVFEGHTNEVTAVTRLDGRHVLSGSNDTTLRLWDLVSGRTTRVFEGHGGVVSAVTRLDAGHALSASWDKTLRLWDLSTGRTTRVFKGHTGFVTAVTRLDERRALSASRDKTLRLWDLSTGQTTRVFEGHTGEVRAVTRLDERHALSASWDKMLRLWDLSTGQTIRVFEGHTYGVTAVTRLDERHALSGSGDRTLRLWDLSTGWTPRVFEGHTDRVEVVTRLDERHALSGSLDNTLRLWDLTSGRTPRIFKGHTIGVSAVTQMDERHVLSGSLDHTLRLWDLGTGDALRVFEGHTAGVRAVTRVDERHALSASDDGTLRLWDLASGGTIRVFEGHADRATAVTRVDGRQALSASFDKTLRLWDLSTGQTTRVFEGHSAPVMAVTRLDERHALSGSFDRTLRLWDLRTGGALRVFEGHAGGVSAVTPLDKGHALSASWDNTLRLWDLTTGITLAVLRVEETPWCLAPLGGGRALVGGVTGKVRVVRVVPEP